MTIRAKYGLSTPHFVLLILQVLFTIGGFILSVNRLFRTGLSLAGMVEAVAICLCFTYALFYVFYGYKLGRRTFKNFLYMFAIAILISAMVSILAVDAPLLVGLSFLSFLGVIFLANSRGPLLPRAVLMGLVTLEELVVMAVAWLNYGTLGAVMNGSVTAALDNFHMVSRATICVTIALCFAANESRRRYLRNRETA